MTTAFSFQRMIQVSLIIIGVFCAVGSTAELREAELKKSIVSINAYRGNVLVKKGTGFVVQSDRYNGYVVTNASLVSGKNSLTVTVPGSGTELAAQITMIDLSIDFAKLKINGLNLPALRFAADDPIIGDVVWSGVHWDVKGSAIGLSKGILINSYKILENDVGILQHSAVVGREDNSSVLLNDCGEVVGFNMSQPAEDANIKAIAGRTLIRMLRRQNIKISQAASGCISEITRAREKARLASIEAEEARSLAILAQENATSLEKRLNSLNQRNERLSAEIRDAKISAGRASLEAAEAQEYARQTKIELEQKTETILAETQAMVRHLNQDRFEAEERFRQSLDEQKKVSASREMMLIIFFAILALVIIGLVVFLSKGLPNRLRVMPAAKTPATTKREEGKVHNFTKPQELAEYVLEGRDEEGIRYLLRISGDKMVRDGGVVIGRNPHDSPYVINHADVSRRHLRMKMMKDRIFIEDLGSTNGTTVNGNAIEEKGPVSITSGDQIVIGSVVMKLRILNG